MDNAAWQDLRSTFGQQALQAAEALQPAEVDFLPHFSSLQRAYPPALARAALEIAILRREAQAKFSFAGKLYFTRPALEQASSYEVASYRARRFQGFERLLDLGCSVGCDTLALAEQAFTVGIDLDELRLGMARANLAALNLADRSDFLQADLAAPLPFANFTHAGAAHTGAFFDPSRRTQERRAFSVHDYTPPLDIIQGWLTDFPALGVKISPGVKLDQLRPYDAEVEFISLCGELKEAVLWFGPLQTAAHRATVLPGAYTFVGMEGNVQSERILPLSAPRAYLYEPDPAILRAGLVQPLGLELDAAQLDPEIAYLTSNMRLDTPFARCWQVEAWMPFGVKPLRAELRQRGVEQVIVKKRGSPVQPEELIHALHLRQGEGGASSRVLFLTQLEGKPVVVICYSNM